MPSVQPIFPTLGLLKLWKDFGRVNPYVFWHNKYFETQKKRANKLLKLVEMFKKYFLSCHLAIESKEVPLNFIQF